MRDRNSVFGVCRWLSGLLVFSVMVQVVGAEINMPDINLPESRITIPWETFKNLTGRAPDTVVEQMESSPPTEITFGKMLIKARLYDSVAEVSMKIDYSVLAEKGWVETMLFPANRTVALSAASLPKGDYLRITSEGYRLVADTKGKKEKRTVTVTMMTAVEANLGVSELNLRFPPATEGILNVSAPASYTEINVTEALPASGRHIVKRHGFSYLLNTASGTSTVSYKLPVRNDTTDNLPPDRIQHADSVAKPVVTVRQETVLYPEQTGMFVFTGLQLSVARSQVTEFSIELPDSFSLLNVHGSGIRSWKHSIDGKKLNIILGFRLEGTYSMYIAGEMPGDSNVIVPAFPLLDVSHQTGVFALCSDKGNEIVFTSATDCAEISVRDFMQEVAPGFSDSLLQYKHALLNVALAGRYVKLPFTASMRISHHQGVPVADALCDKGSIRTVISNDMKILTQVSYSLWHSGRQFLAVNIPDSAKVWSVMVDGKRIAPAKGATGQLKIPLRRSGYDRYATQMSHVDIIYLQTNRKRAEPPSVNLVPAVPDVPVSKLEWIVFFPDEWDVRSVEGSFFAARMTLFGKRFIRIGDEEQHAIYQSLQKSSAGNQAAMQGKTVSLLPESPKHVYAYQILVTEEQPWMKIRFRSATNGKIVFIAFAGLLFAVIGGIVLWRVKNGDV